MDLHQSQIIETSEEPVESLLQKTLRFSGSNVNAGDGILNGTAEPFLTYDKLLEMIGPQSTANWRIAVSSERQSILFYQLNWNIEPPRIFRSVQISAVGNVDDHHEPHLTASISIGEKKLDTTCTAVILGHRGIRNENDIIKLLEHVNQCPLDPDPPHNPVMLTPTSSISLVSIEQARQMFLSQRPKLDSVPSEDIQESVYFLEQTTQPAKESPTNGELSGSPSKEPGSGKRKRRPVECDVCHQIYSTKHSMMLHRQSQHEHIRHTCTYCERSFSYRYDMYTHMTKAHSEVDGMGANCEVCGVLTHFAVLEGHQKKCGRKSDKPSS